MTAEEKAKELYPFSSGAINASDVQVDRLLNEAVIEGFLAGYNYYASQHEWVKVSEPPREDQVLLATNGTYVFNCRYFQGKYYRHVDNIISGDVIRSYYYTDIIAWMPLPSPPKTEV
jgi:hypothetical protein